MKYRFIFLSLALTALLPMSASAQKAAADQRSVAERLQAPDNLRLPPANAVRTASGLRYVILQRGKDGPGPTPDSTIEIDYVGWDFQGYMFDSSLPRGAPSRFPLKGLIKGWQEGVLLMRPGDTFRFWIPGNLAYDGVAGDETPKGKLVFDITLHSFSNGT
ncbi:MAG: FKBP-type peptidyl-prolyl cis-trans isomerase [Arenimonas sp.]|uniref:FKBP-type peptidyl-prolyl cis-trans isomerase n=1 Tax=Arenimonas sp. TaxID=1872635 RepID=UPI003C019D03